ncbi:MAG TPA: nicotinate phosphoribosyltransferase [Candidatus Pacearchaeota archaeon]|nr:nicotinate phosphoribosyltransferase [Candidatus Pacearchaeota archaeon]
MTTKTDNRTMLTDLYELTMGEAYLQSNKNEKATFDMFIRKLPEDWGFFIANGIEDAIDYATNLKFQDEDIEYLRSQNLFTEEYLNYLKNFKFTGEVYSVKEGTPVAPNTPLIRVSAPRIEAQMLETILLNTINFQTMISTKANRIVQAAGKAAVVDFGARRAQEQDAAVKGARAAYLAGAVATSNVMAGKEYGIPISGTHAHSFVMSFPTELQAFQAYVKRDSTNPTLLIDTYDTLQGARNAAIVGKQLEKQGKRLGAVRLDSGDLATLSKQVRQILDQQGLDYVKIVASNDLNEYKIAELTEKQAPINGYGVGTELITSKPVSALPGVYKLIEDETGPKIKLSAEKQTYPGIKQVYRIEKDGKYQYDLLSLNNEQFSGKPLLEKVIKNGERLHPKRNLSEIRNYCLREVAKMPEKSKQVHAEPYILKISNNLELLVNSLKTKYNGVKNENNLLEYRYAR